MKHAKVSNAWRPVRARGSNRRGLDGALSALAFNFFLLLLPLAGAAALIVIARDHLYAYEYSQEGARAVALRVARLNGELIQVDFDRENQWDALVDMELRASDIHAARGFLLSGSGILPRPAAEVLRQADATDAELEVAALQLLTPSTRARYEAAGPLLSQQDQHATPAAPPAIGGAEDFELMARAVLAEPESDTLQFVLTGFGLGLGGDLSPSMARGALVLLDASRREDYSETLAAEVSAMFNAAMPAGAFREAARANADTVTFAAAREAFSGSVSARHAGAARAVLDQLGSISEATSPAGAAALLTHATSLRDLPRLTLLAQAAGDRAVAAAKRLPRDGRLINAARGQLTMTQDLIAALVVVAIALLGLVLIVVLKLTQAGVAALRRFRAGDDFDYGGGELVEISTSNWRPVGN
ncbi:MAG: hypothetical protein H7124_01680 [Phycisphaerales bacterium]|nr:hypothetical protein [Hyphomonadaceae bacterium]